jgi:hypothetical protein
MTPEEQQEVVAHSQAIAKILYRNTKAEELTSLGKIAAAVRDGLQEHVMPEVGIAWCNARWGNLSAIASAFLLKKHQS